MVVPVYGEQHQYFVNAYIYVECFVAVLQGSHARCQCKLVRQQLATNNDERCGENNTKAKGKHDEEFLWCHHHRKEEDEETFKRKPCSCRHLVARSAHRLDDFDS